MKPKIKRSQPFYSLAGNTIPEQLDCFSSILRDDLNRSAYFTRIEPLPHPLRSRCRVWLQDGQSIIARRVVLASGSGKLQLPDWVSQIQSEYPKDRLCHSQQVNLRGLQLADERVLIVGGGLTALQVGPAARNLLGARIASERIVLALTKSSIALSPARSA